ncbi:MAG: hypothetical protein IJ419_16315 [Agathobacter sp.]|nr:hypothetical protein [Agathobacter sp.]
MFLGFDDSLKSLKKELKESGVDMSVVRDWQKYYDKVTRQKPQLENQYQIAKNELETVLSLLKDAEQLLIAGGGNKESLAAFAKELRKYQGHFNHEFLISKEDSDFHLTFESILNLCNKDMNANGNALILQSEIENLIALTVEALDKEWPDFRAMAFYYIERTDKEIFDLPHADKVAKVRRVYENEFLKPLRECMLGRISEKRMSEIMEEELWKY